MWCLGDLVVVVVMGANKQGGQPAQIGAGFDHDPPKDFSGQLKTINSHEDAWLWHKP